MYKYTVRKLIFVGIVFLLGLIPFGYGPAMEAWEEYQNPDPFKAMARYIESFEKGGVDVLIVFEAPSDQDKRLAVLVYIEDYPDKWTKGERENFTRWNINVLRDYGYEALELALGWDYPPPRAKIQGVIVCLQARATSCLDMQKVDITVRDEFQIWAGIGKP